jgi:hypothetical protein
LFLQDDFPQQEILGAELLKNEKCALTSRSVVFSGGTGDTSHRRRGGIGGAVGFLVDKDVGVFVAAVIESRARCSTASLHPVLCIDVVL